jgi:N6-adenosine-specific RNA methylase IME4
MPPLSDDEFSALKADIKARGVQVPIEYDEDGNVLDGHHRLKAVEELLAEGFVVGTPPRIVRTGLSEPEKRAHARALNLARRHLDQAQKRAAIAAQIKDTPERSNRQIAAGLGVHHTTVSTQRAELEEAGDVAKLATSTDTLGRQQPRVKTPQTKVEIVTAQVARGELSVMDAARQISQETREAKKAAIVERLETVAAREIDAPTGLYDVIVIDPPWPMQKIERDVRPNQVAFDYPTMEEDELSELSIPADADCHVWLWTTHKFIPMAFRLLDAWGLKYVCTFVWHKPGGFQPIGLPQYNAEFAIYARKGSPSFIDTKAFPTCFNAPRGAHSEKPEEFYEIVRRVTCGRRLDMFNRRKIEGFNGWGKESQA